MDQAEPEIIPPGTPLPDSPLKTLPDAFDYSALDPGLAGRLRATAERIRARSKEAIIETGRDLIAIKDELAPGTFIAWVRAESGMTVRTAQNCMAAAREFGDRYETVAYLPAQQIYKLASPNTSETIREEVIERAGRRERITNTVFSDILKAHNTGKDSAKAPESEKATKAQQKAARDLIELLTRKLGEDLARAVKLYKQVGPDLFEQALRNENLWDPPKKAPKKPTKAAESPEESPAGEEEPSPPLGNERDEP